LRLTLRLDVGGRATLGPGKARLLELIGETAEQTPLSALRLAKLCQQEKRPGCSACAADS